MAKKKAPEPEKPRLGRPPKEAENKVHRLAIYVPLDVLESLEALAQRDGVRSSAIWAAQALTRLARADVV